MVNTLNKTVIVGATSAIAEHCARQWLQQGPAELWLVGRDAARLQRVADDLQVRSPSSTLRVLTLGFDDPQAIAALLRRCCEGRAPQRVLIAHGLLPDQAACQQDLQQAAQALWVNGNSAVLLAEGFAGAMQRAGGGCLGVIGSVAGDRGRKSNYVYGAAKGLVERYLQGLQHRLAGTAVRVVLIKPGPTDTPMTARLRAQGRALASVEQVAADAVRGMARGRAVVYTPGRWRWVMAVVRALPRALFHKLEV